MKVTKTSLPGVLVLEPDVFKDNRGFFMETFHVEKYRQIGICETFVQDNMSLSKKGTLRGLHFQIKKPQAKLVQVISGEIFDVAIDIRPDSKTFKQWTGVILSGENKKQLFIPQGFAHGFCVLSQSVYFSYKCSDFYSPGDEGGILWSDPDIDIKWPITGPIISEKDQRLPLISTLAPHKLFQPES